LYGKLRPYLDKAAVAEWSGVCSTDILALAPVPGETDPLFLGFVLHTESFLAHAIATTSGVNHPRTSWRDIAEYTLAVPPLREQQGIASFLRKMEATIHLEEARTATLLELKAATMAKVFAEGLQGADSTNSDYGLIPSGWPRLPLRECATIQTGLTKGRSIPEAESVELPYLRVANVQDGYLDLAVIKTIRLRRDEVGRYLLRPGDVLLTEGGDFDKLGRGYIWNGEIAQCVHQNHVFAVRSDRQRLLPEFFAFLAQSPYGKRYFLTVAHKTTNLACINSTKLGDFPVLLPSINEQREIVNVLDAVDRRINISRKRKAELTTLFRATLGQLMSGQIRVTPLLEKQATHA
jgi:type I restriction enzyme S subunit